MSTNGSPTEDRQPPTVHRRPPKVFEAWERHEYTFFILHGRGDSATNFAPSLLCSPTADNGSFQHILKNTKMVFLAAGIAWFGGGEWFEISSLRDPNERSLQQVHGLSEHAKIIRDMVEIEVQSGIPCERIVLIGLSQGCAQSLFTLLTLGGHGFGRLGAVVGMSGWLPFSDTIGGTLDESASESTSAEPASREHALQTLQNLCKMADLPLLPDDAKIFETPVFIGHGTGDMKVHPKLGEIARDTLQRLGFKVEWFPYHGFGHWWKAPEEIDDIIGFLRQHIGLEFSHERPPASYPYF